MKSTRQNRRNPKVRWSQPDVIRCSLLAMVALVTLAATAAAQGMATGPAKVKIRQIDSIWQLYRDGSPYYIKGAGVEFGDVAELAARGANSFRTWTTENGRTSGRELLDLAQQHGLTVAMGLGVGSERHGFNYGDSAAIARQLERIRGEVLKYKDHPALLMWVVGNELNLQASDPSVWDAVNEISKMIHQVDPNHPTMTPLAGFDKAVVGQLKARAPDLDLVGIQMYADVVNIPRYLKESGWTGPYVVTEWGATGHWESPTTAWKAPIENDSTVKAELYRTRYEEAIRPDRTQCLGSYVFLWGQKQERTPTWYGMFLASGEITESVDVMQFLWSGKWPLNRCPKVSGMSVDSKKALDNIRLRPDQGCQVRVQIDDPENDTLTYRWELLEESRAKSIGGDRETKPKALSGLVVPSSNGVATMTTPDKPGAYRVFVYVFDGHGNAAHANVPFYVEEKPGSGDSLQSAQLRDPESSE